MQFYETSLRGPTSLLKRKSGRDPPKDPYRLSEALLELSESVVRQ